MAARILLDWAKAAEHFKLLSRYSDVSSLTLDDLKLLVLNPSYTEAIAIAFAPVILEIVGRWLTGNSDENRILTSFSMICEIPGMDILTEHFLVQNGRELFDKVSPITLLSSFWRLLRHDRNRYATYITPVDIHSYLRMEDTAIRYLAIQVLGLHCEASEKVINQWILEYIGPVANVNPEILYFPLIEAERLAALGHAWNNRVENNDAIFELDLCPLVASIGGVIVPKVDLHSPDPRPDFVQTSTAQKNLANLGHQLVSDNPILLQGDSGSGKTFLVDIAHSQLAPTVEMICVHLGEQTDIKALLGTYASGAAPGTFEWRPGLITQAVQQGRWLLIEDIDSAPTEVLATLLPLLEKRQLEIPSRNQVERAKPGFKLIATASNMSKRQLIGSSRWAVVDVLFPTLSELSEIISSLSGNVAELSSVLVEIWESIRGVQRPITTRDLFKLASRLARLQTDAAHSNIDDIFRECVACFARFSPDPTPLAELIADHLGIPHSSVGPLLNRYRPRISESEKELQVGRAVIERSHQVTRTAASTDFAPTGQSLRLLEEICAAATNCEPLLLVGETGTGKTTTVQHLAALSGHKLIVLNISQQMEIGDLVGSVKPVDARALAGNLTEDFDELFNVTFSRSKNHQFCQALEKAVRNSKWSHVIKLWREALKMTQAAKKRKLNQDELWNEFAGRVNAFEARLEQLNSSAVFTFVEGLLIKALRQGHWVLLDELNLAPPDMLEALSGLFSSRPSLTLVEETRTIVAHPDFRIFGCMNPATDIGKRDLPVSVRSRFTELWVDSPDKDPEDLRQLISRYLLGADPHLINDVCELYISAKKLAAEQKLADGTGQKPLFSVRSISRALTYARTIAPTYSLRRSLYEAFCMCFLTVLDEESFELLHSYVLKYLKPVGLNQVPPKPGPGFIQFRHYWIKQGPFQPEIDEAYILTPSVERNLLNLVRACGYPVLIQGPTSSGKTSMIAHLARATGHKCVRINNHEHTDLQEYLGGYLSDDSGTLTFVEGPLVQAVREGHWLVLDELNLAPTDVLEALNRLLDDNRELLVPETQEIVKPHPNFQLFATQNPPGLYAGRKVLSRAFRNRFIELHFGDIPQSELEVILRERCRIAPSYATRIVNVYRRLGERRQSNRVFEKHGFATLRDLFRWAQRGAVGYDELALQGYLLLAERCRALQEKSEVKKILEEVMRVNLNVDYDKMVPKDLMHADVIWTGAMKRMLVLVCEALKNHEPVLLVGDTGSGKTTICQVLAAASGTSLHIVNAHENTETGDLIGAQRPARENSEKLFEWKDGALVDAMKKGEFFLLDEISLADDSVLERLNSVLEAGRSLLLPEKGGIDISVQAAPSFQFLATMNPGGDYGKKELSPALRNRFTEIWIPPLDFDDIELLVHEKLVHKQFASAIRRFSQWWAKEGYVVSVRDVLHWAAYLNLHPTKEGLFQGACMTFVDSLGVTSITGLEERRKSALKVLESTCGLTNCVSEYFKPISVSLDQNELKIGPFVISISGDVQFELRAPTTARNALRVLRALEVSKPILLEGSPGVGKTSLIEALAKLLRTPLTRINLSDQTDLVDLFGSDIPVEGERAGQFKWRDAPFLHAMRKGGWVLLDEMNLASQAVLEGLNACLDHRGTAYIPELDKEFTKHPNFRVFAAQNPQHQGGGRKGLPKSFVNRFTTVYVDSLELNDLEAIVARLYPDIGDSSLLAGYMQELSRQRFGAGAPFEFNLRDTLRWCKLIRYYNLPHEYFLNLIVIGRLRSPEDREIALKLFEKWLGNSGRVSIPPPELSSNSASFRVGYASLDRDDSCTNWHSNFLHANGQALETAIACITQNWPLILVGPSGSGKTHLLRYLAQMSGKPLKEFAITADVDATDLLGEFDQVEYGQQLNRLWAEISEMVRPNDLIAKQAVFSRDLDAIYNNMKAARPLIDKFNSTDFSRAQFRWFDGMLVRAVEKGQWIVLDNANLCDSAVLDRLNSLLEPDGTLLINECSTLDGEPRKVIPHPDFRLFFTVNPRYGELSRAMRNRGIEIWLEDIEIRAQSYDLDLLANEATESNILDPSLVYPARFIDAAPQSKSWLVLPWMHFYLNKFPYKKGWLVELEIFSGVSSENIWAFYTWWTRWYLKESMSKASQDESLFGMCLKALALGEIPEVNALGILTEVLELESPEALSLAVDLWRELTNSDSDIAVLPVFRELFAEIGMSIQSLGITPHSTVLLDQLWSNAPPAYVSGLAWQIGVRLKALSREIDTAIFSLPPSPELSQLRKDLVSALSDKSLTELPEIPSLPPLKEVEPQYPDAFEVLETLSLTETSPDLNLVFFISHFAHTPSSALVPLFSKGLWLPTTISAKLNLPEILIRVLGRSISATHQNQASTELKAISDILLKIPCQLDLDGILQKLCSEVNIPPNGWLDLGRYILSAFSASEIYDPAIRQRVKYDRYMRLSIEYEDDCQVWQRERSIFKGDLCDNVDEALAARRRELTSQPIPSVFRPRPSQISRLFRDIRAAEGLFTADSLSLEEFEVWNANTKAFLNRLDAYSAYPDLVGLVQCGIVALKIGLECQITSSPGLGWILHPNVLASQDELAKQDIPTNPDVLLHYLRIYALHGPTERSSQLLLRGYQLWAADRAREEARYREESAMYHQDLDDDEDDEVSLEDLFSDTSSENTNFRSADWQLELVKAYLTVYGLRPAPTLSEILLDSVRTAASLDTPTAALTEAIYPIYQALQLKIHPEPQKVINFYTENDVTEAQKALNVSTKVLSRISDLLARWPEHDVLLTLKEAAQELQELTIDTPMARYLAKVEQLHHWLNEWRRYASDDSSVTEEISICTSLIIEWRRLELTTWPKLLKHELHATNAAGARLWFNLYETLVAAEPPPKAEEVSRLLVIFMSNATLGQFSTRLELLKAFAKQTSRNSVKAVASYFEDLYSKVVSDIISNEERILGKEITDVVKLASWRDTNVHALKESARKSHRSLYKIVKRYRQFISQNVSTLNVSNFAVQSQPPPFPKFSSVIDIQEALASPVILQRPEKWLKQPPQALMRQYAQKSHDELNKHDSLVELAIDVEENAKRLREDTPKELTEENKKLVGSLRAEKSQLLSSTLRKLRRAGLRISVREDIMYHQVQISTVLANSPSLQYESEDWNRLVELMPKLRATIAESDADIPAQDLRRGLVFSENVLWEITRMRSALGNLESFFKSIEDSKVLISTLTSKSLLVEIPPTHYSRLLASYCDAPAPPVISSNPMAIEAVKDYEDWIQKLEDWERNLPSDDDPQSLLRPIVTTWIGMLKKQTNHSVLMDGHDATADVINVCNAALVSIQELSRLDYEESEDWLSKGFSAVHQSISALHTKEISGHLSKALEALKHHDTNERWALASLLHVFFNGYVSCAEAVQKASIHYLSNTIKGALLLSRILLSLGSEGFCSPSEPQDNEEMMQDAQGTGLGDGEGQKSNNSKDLEEDEGISEMAQTDNPDQKEEESDDGDALEMQGDMAGELEDAPPEGSDEEQEDQDKDDIEDDVGSVNDLDLDAVDEKMWDDEHQEDSNKEKSGENVQGQKDDMEAKSGSEDEQDNEGENLTDGNDAEDENESSQKGSDDDDDAKEDVEQGAIDQQTEQRDALELPEDLQLEQEDQEDNEEDLDLDEEEENDSYQDPLDKPQSPMEEQPEPDQQQELENSPNSEADAPDQSDVEADAASPGEEGDSDEENEDRSEQRDEQDGDEQDSDEEGPPAQEGTEGTSIDAQEDGIDGTTAEDQAESGARNRHQGATGAEGDDVDANDEQPEIGANGGPAASGSAPDEHQEVEQETKDALRQLGDAMSEYSRKRREIQERQDTAPADNDREAPEVNEDVQHVGAEDAYDTQALGKSSEHQDTRALAASDSEDENAGAEEPMELDETADIDAEKDVHGGKENPEDPQDAGESTIAIKELEIEDDNSEEEVDKDSEANETSHIVPQADGKSLWRLYDSKTHDLTLVLTEQLRLILEPTKATKMRGDYKTGKRLNMKRIIPYVASQFKKDKIWMRRTKPSKRQYEIMLAVDDSRSMGEPKVVDLAFQSIAMVSQSLANIDAGKLGILRFGENTDILHPLDEAWTLDSGAKVLEQFNFEQSRTDVVQLMRQSLDMFSASRMQGSTEQWQLMLIVSDGLCEDHEMVRRLVRQARSQQILIVFVILDALNKDSSSIIDMSQVRYGTDPNGNPSLKVERYMDQFPFDYYIIVRNIADLPAVLASVLRQFFQAVES